MEDLTEGRLTARGCEYGNIVMDSLIGYWKRVAENEGIQFDSELSIPMEMPFRERISA